MSGADQADALEQAILERAQELAEAQVNHAEEERERLLQHARERLERHHAQQQRQLRELGERHYRQRLQAAELRVQARLEQLRWTLIEATLSELDKQLQALVEDEARYLELLTRWRDEAAAALGDDAQGVLLQLNQRDRERFGKHLGEGFRLSESPHQGKGGVVLYRSDRRARFDNSFEGRRQRLTDALFRTVSERLFGTEANLGSQRGR